MKTYRFFAEDQQVVTEHHLINGIDLMAGKSTTPSSFVIDQHR
jgi:hypothetical protein